MRSRRLFINWLINIIPIKKKGMKLNSKKLTKLIKPFQTKRNARNTIDLDLIIKIWVGVMEELDSEALADLKDLIFLDFKMVEEWSLI